MNWNGMIYKIVEKAKFNCLPLFDSARVPMDSETLSVGTCINAKIPPNQRILLSLMASILGSLMTSVSSAAKKEGYPVDRRSLPHQILRLSSSVDFISLGTLAKDGALSSIHANEYP